jgi:hypothetical protein
MSFAEWNAENRGFADAVPPADATLVADGDDDGGGGFARGDAADDGAPSPLLLPRCKLWMERAASGAGKPLNACSTLASCVASIRGHTRNSASAADIWFLGLHPDIDIGGRAAVMKLWAAPLETDSKRLFGLNFEQQVYTDVIAPLISSGRCTNFVRPLAFGKMCSFRNMLHVLQAGFQGKHETADLRKLLGATGRKLALVMPGTRIDDESAVAEARILYDREMKLTPAETRQMRFNYTVTLGVPRAATTLYEFLLAHEGGRGTWESLSVLFQVAFAIRAMKLSRMRHNDLHANNVFVVPLPARARKTYVVDGVAYTIETAHEALVYDFDRAWCGRFGVNRLAPRATEDDDDHMRIFSADFAPKISRQSLRSGSNNILAAFGHAIGEPTTEEDLRDNLAGFLDAADFAEDGTFRGDAAARPLPGTVFAPPPWTAGGEPQRLAEFRLDERIAGRAIYANDPLPLREHGAGAGRATPASSFTRATTHQSATATLPLSARRRRALASSNDYDGRTPTRSPALSLSARRRRALASSNVSDVGRSPARSSALLLSARRRRALASSNDDDDPDAWPRLSPRGGAPRTRDNDADPDAWPRRSPRGGAPRTRDNDADPFARPRRMQ